MSDIDLTSLRRIWNARSAAIESLRARIDTRGLTRPPRDSDKRRWLAERGQLGTSVEVEEYADAYHAYFRARYGERP